LVSASVTVPVMVCAKQLSMMKKDKRNVQVVLMVRTVIVNVGRN
jgi:hypothetical protein